MALPKQKIAVRPDSGPKISNLVRKLIREADAAGVLPTPLDRLFEVAKVTNIEELPDETFLQTLSEQARAFFKSAKQKLRGIADIREKATYVPRDPNTGRERFAKAHELGHQVIPWHEIDPAYLDDSESLSPSAKNTFEHEANFFGAETIFQGERFRTLVRDFQPSFNAIFVLADQHGASRQSTAWRFVEEQDEEISLLHYYPSNAIDEAGNCVLSAWRSVGSPAFNRRYANIDLPQTVRTGHPWVAARDMNRLCDGKVPSFHGYLFANRRFSNQWGFDNGQMHVDISLLEYPSPDWDAETQSAIQEMMACEHAATYLHGKKIAP